MAFIPIDAGSPAGAYPFITPRPRTRAVTATAPSSTPVAIPPAPAAPPLKPHETASEPDYEVGYKRPPEHTRFRKGQSGNLRGRPKGAKSLKTLVRELLTAKIDIRVGRSLKKVTRMEAMLHKIAEQAFTGNLRALQALVSLYQASVPDDPVGSAAQHAPIDSDALDAHDQAILNELRAAMEREIGGVQ